MSDDGVDSGYDSCLARLLAYGPEYDGGLSNHAPMALEALLSLDLHHAFVGYVDLVTQKLEPTERTHEPADDWKRQLRNALPDLVDRAGSQAGHGLLRVAHAVRALEHADTTVRRRELTAAIDYWHSGQALATPIVLNGGHSLAGVLAGLPRLAPAAKIDGLLTHNLMRAAELPEVVDLMTQAAPATNIGEAFNTLAELACSLYVVDPGAGAFALLHGVTVPVAASTLLTYTDAPGQRRLEAAVIQFVVAAIVGFAEGPGAIEAARVEVGTGADTIARLARQAADTGDDHDIKLAEACARLFTARPTALPVAALSRRING